MWTRSQVDAVNFLLKNKQRIKESINTQDRLYIDHKQTLYAPYELEEVSVSPLCLTQLDDYYILHAQLPSSVVNHWLARFTGTLMTENRHLEILVNIEEWINWEFPQPKGVDSYSGYAKKVSMSRLKDRQERLNAIIREADE